MLANNNSAAYYEQWPTGTWGVPTNEADFQLEFLNYQEIYISITAIFLRKPAWPL